MVGAMHGQGMVPGPGGVNVTESEQELGCVPAPHGATVAEPLGSACLGGGGKGWPCSCRGDGSGACGNREARVPVYGEGRHLGFE